MLKDTLKELRESKHLTKKQVALGIGITERAYIAYEYGERDVSTDTLVKIAKFYNVSTDYLLGLEPQKNPLADLEIDFNKSVDSDKFIELYSGLPELAKQIFVEIMAKLSQAIQPNTIRTKTTYICGELEDRQKAEADEAKDAG
ncbi:MAG: helix-turn-helix transcriptional regulator [Hominimerdicola sp.]